MINVKQYIGVFGIILLANCTGRQTPVYFQSPREYTIYFDECDETYRVTLTDSTLQINQINTKTP